MPDASHSPDTDWFARWFDTPFYHLLYSHRDEAEAQAFLETLVDHLDLEPGTRILDLACGQGRHARTLAAMGFDVTGIDLSARNIERASEHSGPSLRFEQGDMRDDLGSERFDVVMNLFTSFGYFESEDQNEQVLRRVYDALVPGGRLVIDFLNVFKTAVQLRPRETVTRDGVEFLIKRSLQGKHIVKDIEFMHEKRLQTYQERVQGLNPDDFKRLFKSTGFVQDEVFGNYALDYYSKNTSDRLILVAHKPV